ncbi:MBL fold metallo-hydrolase [Alistipes sp.]|uniref:MBL fold metallo-hydrolase n=1 Tax=Alistipes sp. TaxID=1872444 RepID=UPI003AF0A7A7
MKLHVLTSSSTGNCYVLESEASALVIECGASPDTMLARTGIGAAKFVGALVTHEHGDHAAHVGKYAGRAFDIYASRGTLAACRIEKAHRAHALRPMQSVAVGDFIVRAFDVEHDAAEPFGYIIEHRECGKVLFATDTHFIRYNFRSLRLNHILIEANYSHEELDDRIARSAIDPAQAARVRASHLSIGAACDLVRANATAALTTVVLLHLSAANSRAEAFAAQMRKTAPFARVFVADKGLVVGLDKSEI